MANESARGDQYLVDSVTPTRLRHGYAERRMWTTTTLSEDLRRHAAQRPDSVAVVDMIGTRQVTFGALDAHVDAFCYHLTSLGVGQGDVVAVQLPNCLEAVVVDLAALRINAVLNPMIPAYRDRDVEFMLRRINSKLLITPGTYRAFDHNAMAARLRQNLPRLRSLDLAPGSIEPEPPGRHSRWDGPARELGSVSMVLFSSGTESTPKAIMHTEQTTGAAARAAVAAMGLRADNADDVVWTPTPIGHSTGFNYGVRLAITAGAPLVLQDRWDSREALSLVREFGCSLTVGVPTMLRDLIGQCRADNIVFAAPLRFFTGGAPVDPTLIAEGQEVGIMVNRLYGSTETLAATCTRPGWPRELRAQNDGAPLQGVEVELRPAAGLTTEVQGEVYIRSPSLCVGFAHDAERTLQMFDEDGWFQTGDLGTLDDAGHLTIVGRAKEILIRGGMNIAPREIEELLLTHAGVTAVAIVGLPDIRLGELCCAVVVPAPNTTISLTDVTTYLLGAGLASYKLPEQLVLREALPLNASGKVLKKQLVESILND